MKLQTNSSNTKKTKSYKRNQNTNRSLHSIYLLCGLSRLLVDWTNSPVWSLWTDWTDYERLQIDYLDYWQSWPWFLERKNVLLGSGIYETFLKMLLHFCKTHLCGHLLLHFCKIHLCGHLLLHFCKIHLCGHLLLHFAQSVLRGYLLLYVLDGTHEHLRRDAAVTVGVRIGVTSIAHAWAWLKNTPNEVRLTPSHGSTNDATMAKEERHPFTERKHFWWSRETEIERVFAGVCNVVGQGSYADERWRQDMGVQEWDRKEEGRAEGWKKVGRVRGKTREQLGREHAKRLKWMNEGGANTANGFTELSGSLHIVHRSRIEALSLMICGEDRDNCSDEQQGKRIKWHTLISRTELYRQLPLISEIPLLSERVGQSNIWYLIESAASMFPYQGYRNSVGQSLLRSITSVELKSGRESFDGWT